MGKLSELDAVIKDLRSASATILEVADTLAEMFCGKPTEEAAPTLEAVRAVLAEKSRTGHTAEVRSLLEKYGATKLSQIDPANYKSLLADAEVITDAD